MNRVDGLRAYWADVRAGRRSAPVRKTGGPVRRRVDVELGGSFGCERDKRLVVTLHPNGLLELRPEHSRHVETVSVLDVYRFAIRCRVGRGQLEKARAAKERKAIRLAAQRQRRAEKRLVEGVVRQPSKYMRLSFNGDELLVERIAELMPFGQGCGMPDLTPNT